MLGKRNQYGNLRGCVAPNMGDPVYLFKLLVLERFQLEKPYSFFLLPLTKNPNLVGLSAPAGGRVDPSRSCPHFLVMHLYCAFLERSGPIGLRGPGSGKNKSIKIYIFLFVT